MAHTPSPWHIAVPQMGFSSITGPEGQLIFGLAAGGSDEKRPDDECDANARLIAVSPDMFGILKLLTEQGPYRDDHPAAIDMLALIKMARAAIAKVEEL